MSWTEAEEAVEVVEEMGRNKGRAQNSSWPGASSFPRGGHKDKGVYWV